MKLCNSMYPEERALEYAGKCVEDPCSLHNHFAFKGKGIYKSKSDIHILHNKSEKSQAAHHANWVATTMSHQCSKTCDLDVSNDVDCMMLVLEGSCIECASSIDCF